METLSRNWARSAFVLLGVIGILSGLGVAFYTTLVVRPRVAAVTNEVRGSLQVAERVMENLKGDTPLTTAPLDFAESGSQLIALLPQTLTHIKGVLVQGSNASSASGATAKETKKGITGLVVPKKEITETNQALQATAYKMRLLAGSIDKLTTASSGLAKSTAAMTRDLDRLRPALASGPGVIVATGQKLQAIDRAVGAAALPLQVTLLGLGLGALLILSGLISLMFALALRPDALAMAGSVGDRPSRRVA